MLTLSEPRSVCNTNPLALLFDRCTTLATRVRDGDLAFVDAVDMAYTAADFAGLVDRYGDDSIQGVLAEAFMGAEVRP
jgi:hypothetical protein